MTARDAHSARMMRARFRSACLILKWRSDSKASLTPNLAAQSCSSTDGQTQSIITNADRVHPVLPDPLRTAFSEKSATQVAPSVLPHVVLPKAGELKLRQGITSGAGKRSSPLTIRASDSQKELLRRKARSAGISLNRYMLAAALGDDDNPPPDPQWTKALLACNRELTRQGNNLNQIAHRRNTCLIDEAETNTMLGLMVRAYLETHRAVRLALSFGKDMPPEP